MPSRPLSNKWCKKRDEILKTSNLSIPKKLLAYKILLRPMLIYKWFEFRQNKLAIKKLEAEALRLIFGTSTRNRCLYKKYTDLDVTAYMNIQAIRWRRATGSPVADLREMLHAISRYNEDPAPYFTRSCRHRRHSCTVTPRRRNPNNDQLNNSRDVTAPTIEEPTSVTPTLNLRRSKRLSQKSNCNMV